MKPARPTFAVETSCGEDAPTIHLYFGDDIRIKVADSIEGFDEFADHICHILAEIRDTYPNNKLI